MVAARQRDEGLALHRLRDIDAGEIQERRHHVHDSHLIRDLADGDARAGQDQRDPDGLAIHEEPVFLLLMIAKRLAVIAEHGDDRPVQTPIR